MPTSPPERVRFGPFEADLAAGELRKRGLNLRLGGQPFEILSLLVENPGEVVTRDQLRRRLWPDETFVDYEHSLNAAINKLRETLSDLADSPVYVETLPRRGYRFIAPVERVARERAAPPPAADVPASRSSPSAHAPAVLPDVQVRSGVRRPMLLYGAAAAVLLAALAFAILAPARSPQGGHSAIRSLAVLPFQNLSRDPDQEYFADGITEALISRLAQMRSLHVISRTSAMQYRTVKAPLPEIAQRLGVEAVVEGTVQRSGERVAIFANLIDASSDRSLWSGRYEGDMRDVLGVQSQVAGATAESVRAQATAEERSRVRWSRSVDPAAYAAYLRGRYLEEKGQPGTRAKAVELLEESVRRDPTFALAWVALGEARLFGYSPRVEMPRGKAAALRALEINPSLAQAHVMLGLAETFWDWDWTAAEKSFQRALELNPASSEAHHRYAHLLVALGRFDEAIAECRRALELDPLSAQVGHYLGRVLYFARRYDEAVEQFQKVLALDPNDYWSNLFLSNVYAKQGRFDKAQSHLERWAALEGTSAETIATLNREYRRAGHAAALRKMHELGHPPLAASGAAWLLGAGARLCPDRRQGAGSRMASQGVQVAHERPDLHQRRALLRRAPVGPAVSRDREADRPAESSRLRNGGTTTHAPCLSAAARYQTFPAGSFTPALRSPGGWSRGGATDSAPARSARS